MLNTTGLDLTMAAEFITGISEDDYADAFADTVEQYYEGRGRPEFSAAVAGREACERQVRHV